MTTKIEWAQEVWNPITGCTQLSEGCKNCYAKRMAPRLRGRYGYPADDPFRVTFHPDRQYLPATKWKKPRTIFVCSMGDLFHNDVMQMGANPGERLFKIYDVMMNIAPWHTYLVLTKRPDNAKKFYDEWIEPNDRTGHIYLGVSAENQQRADERIPTLLQIPAANRFVSVEPMLWPIDLKLRDYIQSGSAHSVCRVFLDGVILGGESGPRARPMHPDWVRNVRDQCVEAGVPFMFKQWGEFIIPSQAPEDTFRNLDATHGHDIDESSFYKVGKKAAGRLLDGREWNDLPWK